MMASGKKEKDMVMASKKKKNGQICEGLWEHDK